ncbi:MAG: 2,3-bisphosphoglycerate-independent phosphoglycerate mutase, partial [Bacteroidales bacterium]|nr:2,3-bisphosphoglycerate-independent phosphoglycerate mutase [Bacteroidales bacterium]
GKKLHLMGLTSMGGVHSSLSHVYEFLSEAKNMGLDKVYVHAFMDGRDTDPHSGKGFLEDLEAHMAATTGKIATVCGRFYAMDRDKRWNRVKEAYDMLVEGKGAKYGSAIEAIEASYAADVTDEFVKPAVITDGTGEPLAKIEEGDAVIFYNFRNDRARELTAALTQHDMPEEGMHTIPLHYCCLTPYDASFTGVHILFDKELVCDTLGETVSKAGRRQLRIAETEKYAHVTFFFNGGREAQFEGEDRILVNSPKVATYDLQPEMSAPEVTEKLVAAINEGKEDMIILNFANGDMVGHTGVYPAICKAVETVDGCVKKVVEAAIAQGYAVLLTADHGNADYAVNEDGTPNTAHSLNPVQFIVINTDAEKVADGCLADVAPTILKLMGIPQPAAMTGKSLI